MYWSCFGVELQLAFYRCQTMTLLSFNFLSCKPLRFYFWAWPITAPSLFPNYLLSELERQCWSLKSNTISVLSVRVLALQAGEIWPLKAKPAIVEWIDFPELSFGCERFSISNVEKIYFCSTNIDWPAQRSCSCTNASILQRAWSEI